MIEKCQLGQLYFVTKLKFMGSPYEKNQLKYDIYLIKVYNKYHLNTTFQI